MAEVEAMCELIVKWSAKEYLISLPSSTGTVMCLKKAIEIKTGVKVERQKLLNLKFKGTLQISVIAESWAKSTQCKFFLKILIIIYTSLLI